MSGDGHAEPEAQSGPLIEPIADDEVDAFWRASSAQFGEDVDPEERSFHRALTEVDRTFAARDGSQMVAMGAARARRWRGCGPRKERSTPTTATAWARPWPWSPMAIGSCGATSPTTGRRCA